MDGQSVKTTERGGVRGFDGYKRVKGRKRQILVDTLGLPIANRVEPANISDRHAGELLLTGLSPLYPGIQTVMADAGHESRKLARQLLRDNGWKLQIVKRKQPAFEVIALTWIVATEICMARPQPATQQRLRICGTEFGDDDRYRIHSVNVEPAGSCMNFSNIL